MASPHSEIEVLSPTAKKKTTTTMKPTPASTVRVHMLTGRVLEVSVDLEEEDVASLKDKLASQVGLADRTSLQLTFGAAVLERGLLASYGIENGSRLDMTLRLKSGLKMAASASSTSAMESLARDIAHMLPPGGLTQPLELTFQHQGQTVTVTISPSDAQSAASSPSSASPSSSRTFPSSSSSTSTPSSAKETTKESLLFQLQQLQMAQAMEVDDDDFDSNDKKDAAEEQRRRFLIMQKLADLSREEQRQEKQRGGEHKRVASKIQDLQERLRAKRANRTKALHATTTVLPSGQPAVAPAPAPAPATATTSASQPKGFAGLRRGFLFASKPKSTAAPTAAPATPPASSSSSSSSSPDATKEQDGKSKTTFGGLQPGFLQKRRSA